MLRLKKMKNNNTVNRIEIQNLDLNHYKQLIEVMKVAYPNWTGSFWSEDSRSSRIYD